MSDAGGAQFGVQLEGIRMPLLPITLERTIRACATLPLDANTIFACSYPKSGTTWLQNMLYELCVKGERPLDHISQYCPFFENDKTWDFRAGDDAPVVQNRFADGHAAIGARPAAPQPLRLLL